MKVSYMPYTICPIQHENEGPFFVRDKAIIMYWYNGAVAKCHRTDTFYSPLPSMGPILFPRLHPWVGHFFWMLSSEPVDGF